MQLGRLSSGLVGAALLAAVCAAAVQTVRLNEAAGRGARAALLADSLQAARDTTRTLHIDVAVLGDSLRVVERRAIQTAQQADALDHALGLERVAREQFSAQVKGLKTQAHSDTVFIDRADGERHAEFDVRQVPYRVHAQVVLPPAPQLATMDVAVTLDPLPLDLRVGCGPATAGGVRSASATVVAPTWATVRLDRVEQAPGVCAADVQHPGPGRWSALTSIVARFGVSVAYVAARAPNGVVVAGPGIAAGFRVWP